MQWQCRIVGVGWTTFVKEGGCAGWGAVTAVIFQLLDKFAMLT